MTVGIVDYGMGNLGSVGGALAELGVSSIIAREPQALAGVTRVVLPGVGSFAEGMTHLRAHGWVEALCNAVDAGKPLLGICLGMQLLASKGTEGGNIDGLGLVPGEVLRLDAIGCTERIPHIGWNSLRVVAGSDGLLAGIPDATDFYFVHSFILQPAERGDVLAEADYGVPFTAAIRRRHVFGTQFHPEKSSKAGLRVLTNFLQASAC